MDAKFAELTEMLSYKPPGDPIIDVTESSKPSSVADKAEAPAHYVAET